MFADDDHAGVFDLSEACTVTVRNRDGALLDTRRFISTGTAEAFADQAARSGGLATITMETTS